MPKPESLRPFPPCSYLTPQTQFIGKSCSSSLQNISGNLPSPLHPHKCHHLLYVLMQHLLYISLPLALSQPILLICRIKHVSDYVISIPLSLNQAQLCFLVYMALLDLSPIHHQNPKTSHFRLGSQCPVFFPQGQPHSLLTLVPHNSLISTLIVHLSPPIPEIYSRALTETPVQAAITNMFYLPLWTLGMRFASPSLMFPCPWHPNLCCHSLQHFLGSWSLIFSICLSFLMLSTSFQFKIYLNKN